MPAWFSNATAISLALVLTTAAAAQPGGGQLFNDSEFLPVDEAFSFYVSLDADDRISVHFEIAEGYYLYRQSLSFHASTGEDERRLEPRLPRGIDHHDQYFGDVEVYYESLQAALPLPTNLPDSFVLVIQYQGCAEDGLCYPPQTRRIEIEA